MGTVVGHIQTYDSESWSALCNILSQTRCTLYRVANDTMTNVARSALRSVQSVLVDLVVRSYEKGCVRVRKHAYIVDQHQDKNESHLIYSHPLFVCVAERTPAHSNQPFRELKRPRYWRCHARRHTSKINQVNKNETQLLIVSASDSRLTWKWKNRMLCERSVGHYFDKIFTYLYECVSLSASMHRQLWIKQPLEFSRNEILPILCNSILPSLSGTYDNIQRRRDTMFMNSGRCNEP